VGIFLKSRNGEQLKNCKIIKKKLGQKNLKQNARNLRAKNQFAKRNSLVRWNRNNRFKEENRSLNNNIWKMKSPKQAKSLKNSKIAMKFKKKQD